MNETTLMLRPNPNAKAEFLATVEPFVPRGGGDPPSPPPPFELPFEVTLDGYSREPWSSGRRLGPEEWRTCLLVSTDGRRRLPGFVGHLRERRKAAVCRFDGPAGERALLVVPHDPPEGAVPGDSELPEGVARDSVIFVKYLRDERLLNGGSDEATKRKHQEAARQQKMQQQATQATERKRQAAQHAARKQQSSAPSSTKRSGKKGAGGLLGNLMCAQQRTERALDTVRSQRAPCNEEFDPTSGAAGVINRFRNKVLSDLEGFKSDPSAATTKVSISLPALTRDVPADERDRVTMEALKFTVYDAVDEVGDERWVAAREPSEFIDEMTVSVYKEGHCPPEVLEDMNRGDLPDEVKGAAKFAVESQSRAVERRGREEALRKVKGAVAGEGDVAVLNTNKRDRRTIEQIQRGLDEEDEEVKRRRFEQ